MSQRCQRVRGIVGGDGAYVREVSEPQRIVRLSRVGRHALWSSGWQLYWRLEEVRSTRSDTSEMAWRLLLRDEGDFASSSNLSFVSKLLTTI